MIVETRPTLEELQRTLRLNFCAHCDKRPHESEFRTHASARSCESTCQRFLALAQPSKHIPPSPIPSAPPERMDNVWTGATVMVLLAAAIIASIAWPRLSMLIVVPVTAMLLAGWVAWHDHGMMSR